MLHILNGGSTANTLEETAIEGDKFAWTEALIDGPAHADVSGEAWRSLRAQHLSEAYGVAREDCERELREQEQMLQRFADHEEVALWFETDLFCQVNLIYLIAWFARRELGTTRLSLICPGEFPGLPRFRGLGELHAGQLASLFDSRHELTLAERDLAAAAWTAYGSPNPLAIQDLSRTDLSSLPYLGSALTAHLARFPSTKNGLGRIENAALALVAAGSTEFVTLFPAFQDAEPLYGLGDSQLFVALKRLAEAPRPLLTIANGTSPSGRLDSAWIAARSFALTTDGHEVLQGRSDFVEIDGIDRWLGGAHLTPDNLWRWEIGANVLVRG